MPIRPVVNNISAPNHKLSKIIAKKLKEIIHLENKFTIKNSYELIEKLKNIKICNSTNLASFDITNLYTNIPIDRTINIIQDKLTENNHDSEFTNEIVKVISTIMNQNYFQLNNDFYKQNTGIPMGNPLSGIISEIFLQNLENKNLQKIIDKHKIQFMARYVDDIIIIYDEQLSNIDTIFEEMNKIDNNIEYTIEKEHNNKINYLDLTIIKNNNKIEYDIYRKPTHTEICIHRDSRHPMQQKLSTFHSLIHRLRKIPMTKERYNKELNYIKNLAIKNGYSTHLINNLIKKAQRKEELSKCTSLKTKDNNTYKWITLTYTGSETHQIANIIKKHNKNIKIAYKTDNNLKKIIPNQISKINKYDKRGVYKINCKNCEKFYIGMTNRNFNIRYKEHIQDFLNNRGRSNYANHLLNQGHEHDVIENSMEILHVENNFNKNKILEEIEILKASRETNDIVNDVIPSDTNALYNLLIETQSSRISLPGAPDDNGLVH